MPRKNNNSSLSISEIAGEDIANGLANATPSWTYEAADNRASDSTVSGSWTYDNLNRMTASPGYTYINTIGGNRLEKTGSSAWAVRHSWDDLNRMTQSYVNGSNDVVSMTYRADGLRVTKANAVPGNNANKFTHYRYDGQMGIEDVEVTSGGTFNSVTRYALGGRGIDAISRTTSGGTAVTYPLYDAHGNNMGQVTKSGSLWSISDERSYDAWGQVRSGGATGDQKGRYAANLGHKQDDESAMIYMRARFYEPASGRFYSQDAQRQGKNYFAYCEGDPINKVDRTGNSWESESYAMFGSILKLVGFTLMVGGGISALTTIRAAISECAALIGEWRACIGFLGMMDSRPGAMLKALDMLIFFVQALESPAKANIGRCGMSAIIAITGYSLMLRGQLFQTEAEFIDPYSPNEGLGF